MPLAPDILLLHEAGPDRQALASYLERQGLKTTVCDETRHAIAHLVREGVAQKTLVLAHQKRLAAATTQSVDALRPYQTILIVPSGTEPLPGFLHMVREPFFLDQLVKVIKGTSAAGREPDDGAPRTPRGSAEADLLRGLAHAINNPLTAALGWLRLLESEIDERDQKRRLVIQARGELERLGQLSQGLALVANPPGGSTPFDLGAMVGDRVHHTVADGGRIAFRPVQGRRFLVAGNPVEWDLVLRLLLATAGDSKSLDQIDVSVGEKNGMVELAVRDPKAVLPDPDAFADLGRLLRIERHQRAMAIALGQSIARRAGGTLRCEALHPRGAALVLSVPESSRAADASKGLP
jgi:signal transduction histidine kinase